METKIEKVNPKEFGLEEKTAKEIESHFAPALIEREALIAIYAKLITGELTPELCISAKELRNKLVKVRTHIARIHKTEKAFYLAGGKFVDAWKNKNTAPVEEMESKLMEIEKHFEKIEADRIAKLGEDRRTLLLPLAENEMTIPAELGYMSDDIWESYLTGQQVAFDARKKAEKEAEEERIKQETKDKLHNERKELLVPYWNFMPFDHKDDNFGTLTDAEWKERFDWTVKQKTDYDKKQEAIKKENERLRKEAEEKERKAEVERKERERLAKIKADKQVKIEADRKEKERKDREAHEFALKKEREAREKLEREQKDKAEAERKEKVNKAEAERLASLAPEKEKIQKWIDSIDLQNIETDGFSKEGIAVILTISNKFNAFKAWAESQKDSIK